MGEVSEISIYEAITDKISIHVVRALAGEIARGVLDKPTTLAILEHPDTGLDPLTAAQLVEFDDLWDRLAGVTTPAITPVQLEDCFFLVEVGMYTIDQAKASMGIT